MEVALCWPLFCTVKVNPVQRFKLGWWGAAEGLFFPTLWLPDHTPCHTLVTSLGGGLLAVLVLGMFPVLGEAGTLNSYSWSLVIFYLLTRAIPRG